ncbi:TIGR03086 family metal-binding protein [Nocardioides sp. C4-1]|uniref:TIGR03086 family metal-binding protein n=1 Tax=Nocardioides sp. C4-1 TaxID=3151851 RepID=UPI003263633B
MDHPDRGVELLERALVYTRAALLYVRPVHLFRPTPCADWDLDRLLDHMHDALVAFEEGAAGEVAPEPPPHALDVRVATLQAKACDLLGAWSGARTTLVRVGGMPVPTSVVVRAAALEITVHGWDVAQATGHRSPLPPDLALMLHPVAAALVDDADRGHRFAFPRHPGSDPAPAERLLAFLGRDPAAGVPDLTGPLRHSYAVRRTRDLDAS